MGLVSLGSGCGAHTRKEKREEKKEEKEKVDKVQLDNPKSRACASHLEFAA